MSKAKRAALLVKRAYGADVYLIGSLARGRTHARSDVDFFVCGVFFFGVSKTRSLSVL
ncbi:MAG: nucleotidyltransferase domain-containing protein [Firmicutes bacterium]|nr:nucleotidyltransferase domain-containing protein [Bacillota bacterium]